MLPFNLTKFKFEIFQLPNGLFKLPRQFIHIQKLIFVMKIILHRISMRILILCYYFRSFYFSIDFDEIEIIHNHSQIVTSLITWFSFSYFSSISSSTSSYICFYRFFNSIFYNYITLWKKFSHSQICLKVFLIIW